MTVRTRLEPSPSGSIHVGNAYAGLFNWLLARKHGGEFVLRIADTDQARVTDVGIRSALEDLRWLGLQWDEGPEVGGTLGPYFQSERFDLYREAASRLLESGQAYNCYCTPSELDERRKRAQAEGKPPGYDGRCRSLSDAEVRAFVSEGRAPAVRFRMPDGETRLDDLVRGEVVWDHRNLLDFVIQRADSTPLYMLAVSYDDMAMAMTHVIRAEEHLSNTPKQIAIISALGGTPPRYGHIPLIVGTDRKKLSKRHGATSVASYREMGFLPEVFVNYLASLSWSIGDGVTERFTVPELIEGFTVENITKNPSAFDLAKLTSWNGDTIRTLPVDEFISRAALFMRAAGLPEDSPEIRAMASLVQERTHRLDEVPGQFAFFFNEPSPDEKAVTTIAKGAQALSGSLEILEKIEPWEPAAIGEALLAWADAAGIKRKEAFQPLRAAVTGSLVSPPLFESIAVLGREKTLARVRKAIASV